MLGGTGDGRGSGSPCEGGGGGRFIERRDNGFIEKRAFRRREGSCVLDPRRGDRERIRCGGVGAMDEGVGGGGDGVTDKDGGGRKKDFGERTEDREQRIENRE